MRLIEYDKLIQDLKDSNIPFDADINEIITTQPIINMDNQVERIKTELNHILDSYHTVPISKIDKIIGYVQSLEHMGLGKHKSLEYLEKFIRKECGVIE